MKTLLYDKRGGNKPGKKLGCLTEAKVDLIASSEFSKIQAKICKMLNLFHSIFYLPLYFHQMSSVDLFFAIVV